MFCKQFDELLFFKDLVDKVLQLESKKLFHSLGYIP
jgi:hypothetical protein